MKNIYDELENYLRQLNEINAKILGLSRSIIATLNEHDEYKSSFKLIVGGKRGETKNSVVSQKEQEMFTIKDTTMRERRGGYEVRFRKCGYDKSFFSTSKTKAIEKAKIFLKSLNQTSTLNGVKVKRNKAVDFFEKFFNDVKRNTVKEITYYKLYRKYINLVKPYIESLDVDSITADTIQTALNNATPRCKEDVKSIFNQCLEYAIGCKIITFNPCKFVKIVKHIRENGKALLPGEITTFKESIKSSELEIPFLIFLYTGIRSCEFVSVRFDFNVGVATVLNGKVKSGTRQTERQIPILKPLYKYREQLENFMPSNYSVYVIQNEYRRITGGRLKDLRHTFATCCRKFVDNELVSIWQGHTLKNITASVYTHFDIQYQIEQSQKIDY